MTVVSTIPDVTTPANTIILTSVADSQNITVTTTETGDSVVDGDVMLNAIRAASTSPSGKESKFVATSLISKESGTDDIQIESTTTTDEVYVEFTTGSTLRVNATQLTKGVRNALND